MEGNDVDPNGSGAGSDSQNGASPNGSSRKRLEQVVIRFAGDSGDGMQLTGEADDDLFQALTARSVGGSPIQ
ncbi:hypothetical protein MAHJHV35_48260 [Mycobacterium avium subsp. hominissuis]